MGEPSAAIWQVERKLSKLAILLANKFIVVKYCFTIQLAGLFGISADLNLKEGEFEPKGVS